MNEFLDSVLIIDDNYEEVSALESKLTDLDIWVTYKHPDELDKGINYLRGRKLIILDLYLREEEGLTANVGWIRKLLENTLGPDFGSYGIVLWTKHDDQFEEFKKRIYKNANKYPLPLFAVRLEKFKYLKSMNFDTIIEDILDALKKDTAAHFFMQLDSVLKKGMNESLTAFIDLVKESPEISNDLIFLLDKIATNYSGVPDAELTGFEREQFLLKAFCDMLYYDVIKYRDKEFNLFESDTELEFKADSTLKKAAFAKINSKMLLDFDNISQDAVFSGNLYKVIGDYPLLKSADGHPDGSYIVMEITPACDSMTGKRENAKLLGGIMFSSNSHLRKLKPSGKNKPNLYMEMRETFVEGEADRQNILFDYHVIGSCSTEDLKDPAKFKLIARAKEKLIADVIQKFSSFSSRLGIPTVP